MKICASKYQTNQPKSNAQEDIEEGEREFFNKTNSLTELIRTKSKTKHKSISHVLVKGPEASARRKQNMSSVETVKDVTTLKLEHRHSLQLTSIESKQTYGFLSNLTAKAARRLHITNDGPSSNQSWKSTAEMSLAVSSKHSKQISFVQKAREYGDRALPTLNEATENSICK